MVNKKMKIKNQVETKKTRKPEELKQFQGELKKINKLQLEKLKENILREGFIAPIFIWNNNILDGHHRLKALYSLFEEGHEIEGGEIPVVEIKAKNKTQAGKFVLSYNTQYAKMTEEGLKDFIKDFDLNIEDLKMTIDLDINLTRIEEHLRGEPTELIGEMDTFGKCEITVIIKNSDTAEDFVKYAKDFFKNKKEEHFINVKQR